MKSLSKPGLFKQVVVRMPAEMADALRADAAKNDRTLAQTVRRAVKRYLEDVDAGQA